MPKPPPLRSHEVHVWHIGLAANELTLREFEGILSGAECARASRFRFPEHHRRFVVRRGALRLILARYTPIRPQALAFKHNAFGKPALFDQGGHEALQFNSSHTADLALIAVTRGRRVGVDVERVHRRFDPMRMAEMCFSSMELTVFRALPKQMQPAAFLRGWTRKESVAKAEGRGLSIPPEHIEVTIDPGHPATILRLQGSFWTGSRWVLHDLQLDREHVAALAVESADCTIRRFVWSPGASVLAREGKSTAANGDRPCLATDNDQ